jgi:hypothetical protein
MNLVLLLRQATGHEDQGFEAQHADSILVILRKLSEDRHNLLNDVLLLKFSREFSELLGAGSSNHRSIFLTELDEFLSKTLLLGVRAGIGSSHEGARADTSSEPIGSSKTDNSGGEDALHLSVGKSA